MTATLFISVILLIICVKPAQGRACSFAPSETLPLRGILSILIIMTHLGPVIAEKWPIAMSWNWFGGPVVACFFFLSGFGLSISLIKKGRAYLDGFLSKRFSKLLPPFILLTAIAVCYNYFHYNETLGMMLRDLSVGITPLATSWYIYAILLYYFAFYIFAKQTGSVGKTGVLLIIFTVVYMVGLRFMGFGGWWVSSIPSFTMGYYAAIYQEQVRNVLLKHRWICLGILSLLVISYFLADVRRNIFQPFLTTMVALSVYVCMLNYRLPTNRFLDKLGGVSYEIYLMQGLMFTFAMPESYYLRLIGIPLASIAGAFVLHRVFNNPREIKILGGICRRSRPDNHSK